MKRHPTRCPSTQGQSMNRNDLRAAPADQHRADASQWPRGLPVTRGSEALLTGSPMPSNSLSLRRLRRWLPAKSPQPQPRPGGRARSVRISRARCTGRTSAFGSTAATTTCATWKRRPLETRPTSLFTRSRRMKASSSTVATSTRATSNRGRIHGTLTAEPLSTPRQRGERGGLPGRVS
jgi:hypothetical protein